MGTQTANKKARGIDKKTMTKNEFTYKIGQILKERRYKKKGNYWFLSQNGILFCVNVQGSQWDRNDYYVNIGVAALKDDGKFPTILGWQWRHRCIGKNGEVNIQMDDAMNCIDMYFRDYVACTPKEFFEKYQAQRIVDQYWL